MTHPLSRRSDHTSDVSHHWLRYKLTDELSGCLFVTAADLAHENDSLSARIALKQLDNINEVHATDRITADTHAGALPKAVAGRLIDGLVRQRTGARNDAHRTLLVNEARHDPDLAFLRSNDSGTIRSHEPRTRRCENRLPPNHVVDGHALGDAHDELDTRVHRLEDRISSAGSRHVDHARRSSCLTNRFLHGIKHRLAQMRLPAAARRNTTDQLRAVRERLLGVKRTLLTRETLGNDLRVLVDQNAHLFAFFAAATTLRAASVRSVAAVMANPLSPNISRALSAFVPSSRTTTGTLTPTFLTALITPSAMMSQRTMPPKMLTSTARTFGFDRISWKAAVTRSVVAPPPTSRKLAG